MGGRIIGPARGPARKHWWQENEAEARVGAAWIAYDALRAMQSYRESDHLRYYCIYGARDTAGLLSANYSRPVEELKSRLPYNVVSEAVDTLQAEVCQSRPRSFHTVAGGKWRDMQRAKKLNKFIQGVFYESRVYEQAAQTFVDSAVIGDGVFQVSEKCGRVHVERILASELYVDEAEAKYGDPRQMYRVRSMAREVLLADPDYQEPDKQAAIENASVSPDMYVEEFQGDMVDVLEAWHLPSGPEAEDGFHTISIRGAGNTKGSELWKEECQAFPFVFDKFRKPILGFWGQSLVARLVGYQIGINRLCKRMDGALKNAVTSLFVPESTGLKREDINNRPDNVYFTKGPHTPVAVQASFIPKDYFEQLDRYRAGAMREAGVSEYDVSMTKPPGLNSGVALREHNFKSTKRMAVRHQSYEQFLSVDLAEAIIECARSIANRAKKDAPEGSEEKEGYKVRVPNSSHFEEIDFLEVDLKKGEYVIQAWSTSTLPLTPEGRKDELVEWMQLGLISGADFLRETQNPDTESYVNLAVSAIDDAQWTVDQILEEGRYQHPEPYQDLELCKKYGLHALRRGKRDRYPKKRLDLLRQFIDACQRELLNAQGPIAPAAPVLPPGPPDGTPQLGPGAPVPPPGIQPPPQLPGPMQMAA